MPISSNSLTFNYEDYKLRIKNFFHPEKKNIVDNNKYSFEEYLKKRGNIDKKHDIDKHEVDKDKPVNENKFLNFEINQESKPNINETVYLENAYNPYANLSLNEFKPTQTTIIRGDLNNQNTNFSTFQNKFISDNYVQKSVHDFPFPSLDSIKRNEYDESVTKFPK